MARALPKALLLAAGLLLALRTRGDAFLTPRQRNEAAAAVAAAMLAASSSPAVAEVPKLSFFGIGGGASESWRATCCFFCAHIET